MLTRNIALPWYVCISPCQECTLVTRVFNPKYVVLERENSRETPRVFEYLHPWVCGGVPSALATLRQACGFLSGFAIFTALQWCTLFHTCRNSLSLLSAGTFSEFKGDTPVISHNKWHLKEGGLRRIEHLSTRVNSPSRHPLNWTCTAHPGLRVASPVVKVLAF